MIELAIVLLIVILCAWAITIGLFTIGLLCEAFFTARDKRRAAELERRMQTVIADRQVVLDRLNAALDITLTQPSGTPRGDR